MPKVLSNVKEDILKVVRDMLLQNDYSQLSVREIASRCGIGTGTLYNYFKSKQEIIASIITSDWNTIMRKIDHSNNTSLNYINKLEFIFNELYSFMNVIHNVWYEDFLYELDLTKVNKIKEKRKILMSQLSNKISEAITNSSPSDEVTFLSDMIARLFISYADEKKSDFENFKPYIIKLLVK